MATQTITDAVVFPQDPGTSPNDGIAFATDPPSGASWALHAQYKSGGGDYVLNSESGSLGFTVDDVNDELTIAPGVCYIKQAAGSLSVQSETGSTYDVDLTNNVEIVYAVLVPTSVTVGLDADTTNDVYIAVNPDTRNSATVTTGNAISEPTDPSILLGVVDSTDGSVISRANDNPDGSYDALKAADSISVDDYRLNPNTVQTPTSYQSGPAHGEGGDAFRGATLSPDGRVVFAPYSSSNVGITAQLLDIATAKQGSY